MGLFFAFEDYGRVNVLVSFLAGCVTGPLLVLIPCVAFFCAVFIVAFFFYLTGVPRKAGVLTGAALILLGAVVGFAGFYAASHIPVVGRQLEKLARNSN
jgi:hypothetical protein